MMCTWGTNTLVSVPRLAEVDGFVFEDKYIDACIAPIVRALNSCGIYTAASCCGHGKGPGSIALHDGRELLLVGSRDEAQAFLDWKAAVLKVEKHLSVVLGERNTARAELTEALEALEQAADAIDRLMGDTDMDGDSSPEFRAHVRAIAVLAKHEVKP